MRMTVLKQFHDKDNFSIIYQVGQVVEFDKERADRLLQLGLATETEREEPKDAPEEQPEVIENTVEETKEQPEETPKEEVQEELPLEVEAPKENVPEVRQARRNRK